MITTCATLIVINFGLLLAFQVQGIAIEIAPPLLFAISAAIFALSYFPAGPRINPFIPHTIKDAHDKIFGYKLKCHYVGLSFFIGGLFFGVANMLGETDSPTSQATNSTETTAEQKPTGSVGTASYMSSSGPGNAASMREQS
jgi:hypothetical protein